jgi:hypothetical protein
MISSWSTRDFGFFSLQLPPGWLAEQPASATLLLQDPSARIALAFTAYPRPTAAPTPLPLPNPERELQQWLSSQTHLHHPHAPRTIPSALYPTATTEALQRLPSSPGTPWYRRLVARRSSMQWRYWAILTPNLTLLVSCNGLPHAVESLRESTDRILASLQLPQPSLLLGRQFTETVVSLARSWFPQTLVAILDDAHLQFGNHHISIHPLHRSYLANPADLPTHVRTFFAPLQQEPHSTLVPPPASWPAARDRLYPLLLTRTAMHNASQRLHCEPWINGLFVAYALSDLPAAPGSLSHTPTAPERFVTEGDLARWAITPELLHEQALHNLIVSSHEYTMQGQKADGFTMLGLGAASAFDAATRPSSAEQQQSAPRRASPQPSSSAEKGGGTGKAVGPAEPPGTTPGRGGDEVSAPSSGDRHNAARILLPELHRKLREHLGATFFAAIPTRGLLLAFSASDPDILARVRLQVAHDFHHAPSHLALSPKLFLVTPDGIAGDPDEPEDLP